MARLVIERLTKDFPVTGGGQVRAVNDLSLTVEESEWLVLVGPSGCGKTTTLRLAAGLEEPDSGTITLDGRPLDSIPARDRDIAMVFQNPALYPHLSVFENMAFGLCIRHVPKTERLERVRAAAGMLGIADCLDRKPMELSGGQRQRVALGRALVRQPKLLLLDEPLSNLDAQTRAQLRTELLELRGRLATTVLYVTHDQHEAMTLGTRVGVLRLGALQQIGTARQLYDFPATMFVAGFLGAPPMNFLPGKVVRLAGGLEFQSESGKDLASLPLSRPAQQSTRLESWLHRPVVLGIRPEHLVLSRSSTAQPWQAIIEAIEELGPDKHVHLALGSAKVVARAAASEIFQTGERLGVGFEARHTRWFDPETEAAISLL